VSPTPLGQAAILEYGQVHRTEGTHRSVCHLGSEHGNSLGNRVFVDGIKDLEMRSPWTRVALNATAVSSQDTGEEAQTWRKTSLWDLLTASACSADLLSEVFLGDTMPGQAGLHFPREGQRTCFLQHPVPCLSVHLSVSSPGTCEKVSRSLIFVLLFG
jgi:hypothetical protein